MASGTSALPAPQRGKDQWEDDAHGLELDFTDLAGNLQTAARDTDVEPTPGETKRGAPDGATELTTDQEAQDPDSLVHPGNS